MDSGTVNENGRITAQINADNFLYCKSDGNQARWALAFWNTQPSYGHLILKNIPCTQKKIKNKNSAELLRKSAYDPTKLGLDITIDVV